MDQEISNTTRIKVGVVDDHRAFAITFANMINTLDRLQSTLFATNGRELLKILSESEVKPDILLMDIRMPEMDGIEATRHITHLYPDIKIIVLTEKDDEDAIFTMFTAGACAYLPKTVLPEQVTEALYEVYVKRKYHADLFHFYEPRINELLKETANVEVNDRERTYLYYLGKGYNRQQIAKAMHVSVHSVKHYQAALKEKFGVGSTLSLLAVAISRGLIKRNNNN